MALAFFRSAYSSVSSISPSSVIKSSLVAFALAVASPSIVIAAPPTDAEAAAAQLPATNNQSHKETYNYLGFGPGSGTQPRPKAASKAERADDASAGAADARPRNENLSTARNGSSRTDAARKRRDARKKGANGRYLVDPDRPLSDTANSELVVPTDEKSLNEMATPATVRSSVSAVTSPVTRPSFEVAIAISSFTPGGTIKLPGLAAYELTPLGSKPMLHAQFAWFPIHLEIAQPISFGPYIEASYAQHNVPLRTATGSTIEGTQLVSMAGQLGGRMAWQPSFGSPWEAHLQLGLGAFSSTQSAASSFANHSASESFASLGVFGERRIWERVGVFVGYEYRVPVRGEPEEIDLQRSNIMAGLSGGFQ